MVNKHSLIIYLLSITPSKVFNDKGKHPTFVFTLCQRYFDGKALLPLKNIMIVSLRSNFGWQ